MKRLIMAGFDIILVYFMFMVALLRVGGVI